MKPVTRIGALALRRAAAAPLRASTPTNCIIARAAAVNTGRATVRAFHGTTSVRGIMPESENPPPKQSEDTETPTVPTDISTTEFHERADEYLNELVERLEEAQEKNPDIEVEYSVRPAPPLTTYNYLSVYRTVLTGLRPASSGSTSSPSSSATCSTSSRQTSRSGSARPYQAPSASTGSSCRRDRTQRRAVAAGTGYICGTARV